MVEGLQIFLKYLPDAEIATDSHIIIVCVSKEFVSMKDEDTEQLFKLGWDYDESSAHWHIYV